MVFSYGSRRSAYSRPASRGRTYRRPYARPSTYSRRPAGSYSRSSRKKTRRYGRAKVARSFIATPKNGFVTGTPLSQYQLAQVDAFDPRAVGVRIPDSNTSPSCAVMTCDDITLTAPPTNAICYAFQPNARTTMISGVGAGVGSWTWPGNFGGVTSSNKDAAVATNYDLIRPVSHGVRISCPLSSTTAVGFVHMAVYPSRSTKSSWDFPTTIAGLADCMWYTRVTISSLTQQPFVIMNKFLDCTAQRYIDTGTSGSRQGDNPLGVTVGAQAGAISVANEWCTILIAMEGSNLTGGALAILSAETLIHHEALPSPLGVQAGGPAAVYDPVDLERASTISAHQNPATSADGPTVAQHLQEGVNIVAQGVSSVAGEFVSRVGPAVREAGMNMAVGAFTQYVGGAGGPGGIPGITNGNRNLLTNN